MSTSKKKMALMSMSTLLLGSFLVLMNTFQGEWNMLRTILAGVGFAGFASLYVALLVSKPKGLES